MQKSRFMYEKCFLTHIDKKRKALIVKSGYQNSSGDMPGGIKNFFLNGNEIIQGLLVGKIVSGGVIQMRKLLLIENFLRF